MATRIIKITASDISTGNLELDDHGHTRAGAGDTIIWQIKNNSGVDAIVSIQEKAGSTNIFVRPPQMQGNNWVGEISPFIPECTVYVYSITWRRGTETKTFDPIISIRPSKATSFVAKIVSSVLAVLGLSFFILMLFNKMKTKKGSRANQVRKNALTSPIAEKVMQDTEMDRITMNG